MFCKGYRWHQNESFWEHNNMKFIKLCLHVINNQFFLQDIRIILLQGGPHWHAFLNEPSRERACFTKTHQILWSVFKNNYLVINKLCSCKGHQDATWHHGFATIVNMAICLIFGYIYIWIFINIFEWFKISY